MTTRRDFVRKAALGSAAFSSVGGFSTLNGKENSEISENKENPSPDLAETDQSFPGWEISFDEPASELILKNGSVSIQGRVSFISDQDQWTISKSRDGIQDRYAIVNLKGISVGYFVFHQSCGYLEMLLYHRYYAGTAPRGILSFEGRIAFLTDSFACRTRADANERVLSLGCGHPDSLWNDSLFSPAADVALRLDADNLRLKTTGAGMYSFALSGKLGELYKPAFVINLEKGYY